ncbi:hypothetical protein MNV49_003475 [Pseudohyphozyma bogoriensis]|nr:hypothetical protein MNV49_003475 [Pseudohyphozyma bogoriensis]
MDNDRIRPSLKSLMDPYNELAFPELEPGAKPAATVSRVRPPTIRTSVPEPIPSLPPPPSSSSSTAAASSSQPKPPPVKKSRFALQREKEAAAAAASASRFELNLDDDSASSVPPAGPKLVGEVFERGGGTGVPKAPSFATVNEGSRGVSGFPASGKLDKGFRMGVASARERHKGKEREVTETPEEKEASPVGEGTELSRIMAEASRTNQGVLSSMSEAQILEEQRQIREEMGLSEGVLRMLMARRKGPAPPKYTAPREVQFSKPERAPASTSVAEGEDEPEEGSPEYIRRRYFPSEPKNSSSLAWIPSTTSPAADSHSHSHAHAHHASSSEPQTPASLLHLTTSSVPAQRANAFLQLFRLSALPDNLLIDITTAASRGIRDTSLAVVSNSLHLLARVLEIPVPPPSTSQLELQEPPPTPLSTFFATSPLPTLGSHLGSSDLAPLILRIILPLSASHPKDLVDTPRLLEALASTFLAIPTSSDPSAIVLLTNIAKSSRDGASQLWERRIAEGTVRFLACEPWEMSGKEKERGEELLNRSLELWTVLARYGVGSNLLSKAASLFPPLFTRLSIGGETAIRTLELMSVWLVCGIDPHVTGHELTWSMVEEWGETAVEVYREFVEKEGLEGVEMIKGSFEVLTSWLEGSKVNKPWRGEKERLWIKEVLGAELAEGGRAKKLVERCCERIVEGGETNGEAALVLNAVRLAGVYECDVGEKTGGLFDIDKSTATEVVRSILRRNEASREAVGLVVALLGKVKQEERFTATTQAILRLRAGDEVVARDLALSILTTVLGAGGDVLKPFVTHSIASGKVNQGRVVAPLYPTTKDIKLTALQFPFVSDEPLLSEDWPLGLLDELLRSGSSEVFKALPDDWGHGEIELVSKALELMCGIAGGKGMKDGGRAVYDLIKIVMLEKDNMEAGGAGSEGEVFRDETVDKLTLKLLSPLRLSRSSTHSIPSSSSLPTTIPPIETISSLVSSAPFYTLYTDLVGLYDSISLSHPTFALLLLPPLAMTYALDYRKLLWMDYHHLLRTIPTPPLDAITDSPGETALASFLYPVETNVALLGAYADALVSAKVVEESFLWFVALHHVAEAVLGSSEGVEVSARKRLAMDLVRQGKREVLEWVIKYGQGEEEVKLAPGCFEGEGRREVLVQLLDDKGVQRLTELQL